MSSKSFRSDEVRAGLYVIAAAVSLLFMLLVISHRGGMGPKKDYFSDFNYVNGIEQGAVVRFGGMKAGEVENLSISPENPSMIRIFFKVNHEIPLKADSIVTINSIGMMGDYYLEIIPGTNKSETLKPGSLVPSLSSTRLDEFFRNLTEIADEVKSVTKSVSEKIETVMDSDSRTHLKNIIAKGDELSVKIDKLVGSLNNITNEDHQKKVQEILTDFRDFTKTLKDKTHGTLDSIDKLVSRLDRITGENEQEISGIFKKLYGTLDNMENITTEKKQDVKDLITDLRATAGHLEEVMRKNKGSITETMSNIRVASENAREFTKKISLYPWTLIWRSKMEPEYTPKAER
ncbi:MAG: MlaD family protein [Candidatus Wallbacteria bacterium]|nr:MlaD family protein [Candidatus Wallbacteria bacterium]